MIQRVMEADEGDFAPEKEGRAKSPEEEDPK
jgi:hypothetical protein